MLRPLPPFRAKPLRKIHVSKTSAGESRKPIEISVKAQRVAVKFVRVPAAPSLKVLGRPTATHA